MLRLLSYCRGFWTNTTFKSSGYKLRNFSNSRWSLKPIWTKRLFTTGVKKSLYSKLRSTFTSNGGWKGLRSLMFNTTLWSIRFGCIAHIFQENVYEFKQTQGESMLPTIASAGEWVHELKAFKLGRNVEMGDCVIAGKPTDPLNRVCKRITGMPGDMILIDPSTSSELTNTPPEAIKNDGFNKYIEVPKGHVWVTGDNLSLSLDSRTYFVLPMGLITGKVVASNSWRRGWFEEGGPLIPKRIVNIFTSE